MKPDFARLFTACVLVLGLTACGHMPEQATNPPADVAGIGPRPHLFGRHAWDTAQARAAQDQPSTQGQVKASFPPVAPPTPPVVVAEATPPPPPQPPVVQPPVAPPVAVAAPPVIVAEAPPPPPARPEAKPGANPLLFWRHADMAKAPSPARPAVPEATPSSPASVAMAAPAKPAKPATPPKSMFAWAQAEPKAPPAPPLAGGYRTVYDTRTVQPAAVFAVHESPGYELKGISSAGTQVVAGTNYRLCLWVRQIGHEANPIHRRMVSATVYEGLDKHMELTSWHEVEACHAGE